MRLQVVIDGGRQTQPAREVRVTNSLPSSTWPAIPSPVTSCLPSPSRELRVEQTRPAACPATGWLRPRSWRSPRQLGITRTRTPRPDALPSPASPGPLSGPTTSCSCDLSPPGIQRNPTRPTQCYKDIAAHSRGIPSPQGKWPGEKKSLVYWAREASAGIRFPISAVSFQQIPGAGEERVATGGSTRAGSGGGAGGIRIRGKVLRLQECPDSESGTMWPGAQGPQGSC